jgi:hypothetical protein
MYLNEERSFYEAADLSHSQCSAKKLARFSMNSLVNLLRKLSSVLTPAGVLVTTVVAIWLKIEDAHHKTAIDALQEKLAGLDLTAKGLANKTADIETSLKKESTTTLFTDRILQQLNTLTEAEGKFDKGAIVLELMGLDIQAHLASRTGENKNLEDLEAKCDQIPSRVALFTRNLDALDASDEAKWVEYALNTDNRIARHTALVALGLKALTKDPVTYPVTADLLAKRFDNIFKLSDELKSPDLAIDALDAISRLAWRYQDFSPQLQENERLGRVLQGMVRLPDRLIAPPHLERQSKDDLRQQLTHWKSTCKTLIDTRFCGEKDRQSLATLRVAWH